MGRHLEVLGVHAATVVAFVIDLLPSRDEPVDICEHHPVDGDGLTIQTHSRVAPSPAPAGCRPLPNPAAGYWVLLNTSVDLLEDSRPAIGHQNNPSG